MRVTESGIVTLVKPRQPENAFQPMLVTESGIVTLVKPEQFANAPPSMLVTESGIVTFPLTPHIKIKPSLVKSKPSTDLYD